MLKGYEGHGTIKFLGTYSTFSWTVPDPETWHGFTFAIRTTASLGNTTVDEGEIATNTGTWSDPGINDDVQLAASVGTILKNADGTWNWSLATTDGPAQTQTVTVTATDHDGASASSSFPLVVNNVAPTVDPIGDTQNYSGQVHQVSTDFTDPGSYDTHTATIDWGDGSPIESALVSEYAGSGTVSGNHQYFIPGSYTVTVVVTDKDGDSGSANGIVEITSLPVLIDIKPGSYPNSINLGNNGNIPVGVFGDAYNGINLDVSTIDWSTVYFAGAPALSIGYGSEDLNDDGTPDQVFHFLTQATDLTEASTVAYLTGQTSDGVYFIGYDSVRVVPPANSNAGGQGKSKGKNK